MLRTILVGFGHAARDLHLPVLRRLRGADAASIGAVDPALADIDTRLSGVRLRADIGRLVAAFPPDETVVHVCTPPDQHLLALARCAEHGYRRFAVEKPMVTRRADIDALLGLVAQRGLDVLVVSNWLSSSLTDAVAAQLEARRDVALAGVELCSRKPRIGRSLASATHTSVFEIEMPHLVALAVRLLDDIELFDARADDLAVDDERCVAMMGRAEMRLSSRQGCDVRLATDLCSPVRERSVTVTWAGGARAAGHYPCDSTDLFSHLRVEDGRGEASHRLLHDDTLSTFFKEAYAWFEGHGPRPRSDAALHARVTRLLIDARERCDAMRGAATDVTGRPR